MSRACHFRLPRITLVSRFQFRLTPPVGRQPLFNQSPRQLFVGFPALPRLLVFLSATAPSLGEVTAAGIERVTVLWNIAMAEIEPSAV